MVSWSDGHRSGPQSAGVSFAMKAELCASGLAVRVCMVLSGAVDTTLAGHQRVGKEEARVQNGCLCS